MFFWITLFWIVFHFATIVIMAPRVHKTNTKGKRNQPKLVKTVTRPKKVMKLEDKVKVLELLDGGMSYAACARKYGVNESTIRYVYKKKSKIEGAVSGGAGVSPKYSSYLRDEAVMKMEKALNIWLETSHRRHISVDQKFIRDKAKSLYARFAPAEATQDFKASRGWFNNFRKRFGLRNVRTSGEAASADVDAAKDYPQVFANLIEEGGYMPEQVFNADETGLFWKKMPARTYISTAEKSAPGFKVAKDRFTMLLCGNAAGHMLKPMMIYKSQRPRALRKKDMNLLPVFYRHNSKAWMTAALFMDWFHNNFVRETEKYLHNKGLPFKVLLVLDNCSSHPEVLKFANEHVQVAFLPKNTTSILQPLDQGVIAVWKAKYTARTFRMIRETMDASTEDNAIQMVKQMWKNFTIADCISFIKETHDALTPSCVNSCWKALWPDVVNDFDGFESVEDEVHHIVAMAREVGGEGFVDMHSEEVNELLKDPALQEMTEQELEDYVDSQRTGDPEEEDDEDAVPETFNLTSLNHCLLKLKEAVNTFVDTDPSLERSVKFRSVVEEGLLPYRQLLKELKRDVEQPPITMYFSPTPSRPCSSSDRSHIFTSPESPEPSNDSSVTVLCPSTLSNPGLLRPTPLSPTQAPPSPVLSSCRSSPLPSMDLEESNLSDREAGSPLPSCSHGPASSPLPQLTCKEESHFSGFEDEDEEDPDDPPLKE